VGYGKKQEIKRYNTYSPDNVPEKFDCEKYFDEHNNIILDVLTVAGGIGLV